MSGIVQAHASKAHAKARTIYLSGPMTGIAQHNVPAFHRAASALRAQGHIVYSPAEFEWDRAAAFPARKAFSTYCGFICDRADAIATLPGWEASKGANIEVALARYCGIEVVDVDALLGEEMAA